jgi:hypothetical protein
MTVPDMDPGFIRTRDRSSSPALLQLAALSAAAAIAMFVWEGRVGLNIPDGGFFWYGVQRVLRGELPIRDFMAYDPGRYYWSAASMFLTRTSGIVALRAGTEVFAWIGVFAGAWIIYRSTERRDPLLSLIAIVTLTAWMYPWFKVFDNTVAIILVCALAHLIRAPSPRSYFVAGVVVGLAAVFGRNHGIYGLTACVGGMAYLAPNRRHIPSALCAAGAGIAVGFAPVLALFAAPGFVGAFVDSIRFLLRSGSTNMALPVPYPWLVPFAQLPLLDALSATLLGIFFLWLIAAPLVGLCATVTRRMRGTAVPPEFVAALLVSIPYAHYAYSRADVVHMAASVSPSIIACFVALARTRAWLRYSTTLLLCGASVLTVGPAHPGWQCLATQCTTTMAGSDRLLVQPNVANDVALLNRLVRELAPNGRNFVVAPYWPGAYALFDRRSPMWATYALWPQSDDAQQREIERIRVAAPGFALINNLPLDGREGQRFSQTNAQIYTFIKSHMRAVAGYGLPDGYELYVPRQPAN